MTEETVLNHPEILELIPHRPPFLMIDRVDQLVPTHLPAGSRHRQHRPHLAGHFPGFPIMPGVLIIEAMAQTAGC